MNEDLIMEMETDENSDIFFNELESWLKFNDRVIYESTRSSNPILERLNFLGIADSNLDEFIRTKYIHSKVKVKKTIKRLIKTQTDDIEEQYKKLLDELRTEYNVNITSIEAIKDIDGVYNNLRDIFMMNFYPILQPLPLSDKLPMPKIVDGSSFIVTKFDDKTKCIMRVPDTELVKIKIKKSDEQTFITSEDLINEFIDIIYNGSVIIESYMIRALRQVDSLIAEGDQYLESIRKQVKKRANGEIQMIDFTSSFNGLDKMLSGKEDKRKRKYPHGLSFLKDIKDYVKFDDKMVYEKFSQVRPSAFKKNEDIFTTITRNDVLVHYPYESFDMSALRLLEEAAIDPDVMAIKQTLYRVGPKSPIVKALCKAAKKGKAVTVLLELKAKMDEENNLKAKKKLEKANCQVIYGHIEIKTHAKITVVLRRENERIGQYINISTGNFNHKTAKIYEDLSYFTKSKDMIDATDLFNYLGGHSKLMKSNKLLIAPETFRPNITECIDECIRKRQEGKNVNITLKCNAFTDKQLANKLYEAAKVGVNIFMIIRGMCIVKPVENIEIISVVGRFLEHSRIYEFDIEGEDPIQYIGSGDLMPRNLDHRVEVLTPIDSSLTNSIKDILNHYKLDNTNAYRLNIDGTYTNPSADIIGDRFTAQERFIAKYKNKED